ncbi:response regulator [Nisaea acidiphila]|uniref:Response regulator n=1 Tax=Nisaea acidiphila TaxID=1862145 RepID=A0A9J7AT93_9PROT|nr:response regulator [Nisaea acidiphila]UUX50074.1 response regulator [Nisaea acidiphila]
MTSRPKIAFVDDESRVLDGLQRTLRGRSDTWDMSFHNDPEEAFREFRTLLPDVAVLDIRMPNMTGIELARKMRDEALETICIVLSGSTDFDVAVSSINDANIFRYYVKPCPPEDLTRGIDEAVRARKNRTNLEESEAAPPPGLTALSTTALELIPYGVIVCDADGKAVFVNSRAGRILSNGRSLSLDPAHRLRALRAAETSRLQDAINKAREEQSTTALTLEGESDKPLRLTAQPFDESGSGQSDLVGLFVFSEDELSPPDPQLLIEMFGLTISESRLTAQIARGISLDEAAAECGITKSSARTYLKNIFLKVGVSRQAELVRTVLTSLATH